MPMDFPDMDALKQAGIVHGFRPPDEGETEAQYRALLADHVERIDLIESMEIRTGHGWNQFTDDENRQMLVRGARRREDV